MSNGNNKVSTIVLMSAAEAGAAHASIGNNFGNAARQAAFTFHEIHERKGYLHLGCKTFDDYTERVENDYGISQRTVYRWMDRVKVETALKNRTGRQITLPLSHATVLAPLVETPELVEEAFTGAAGNEGKLKRIVDRLLSKLRPAKKTRQQLAKGTDGWTDDELDTELSDALDKIENVYGKEDRKAIQNGTIGLPRKDIVTLAKMYAPTMEKLQHLIIAKHWGVDRALKFANDCADEQSSVEELINWCLTTKGLYWTGSFGGFEISVKATTAVKKRL